MFSYYKTWMWRLCDFRQEATALSYLHFRDSWLSFLALVDIDFESSFSCQLCGSQPTIVIGRSLLIELLFDYFLCCISCFVKNYAHSIGAMIKIIVIEDVLFQVMALPSLISAGSTHLPQVW